MADREELLDPTGNDERTTDLTLAPRLRNLEGLTAGLLGNGKTNAELLLTEVARQLQDAYGIRTWSFYTKGYFGTPVEEDKARQIAAECDFAVAAIGD